MASGALFVRIGPDDDVNRYLGAVARDELVGFDGDDAEFERHEGSAPQTPPADHDFWVAESEGSDEQTLRWNPDSVVGPWL